MRSALWFGLSSVIATGLVACGTILAIDGTEPGGGSDGGGGGADGGGGDWLGPVALVASAGEGDPSPCAAPAPGALPAGVLLDGPKAEPATCSCDCGAATVTCPVVTVRGDTGGAACNSACGAQLDVGATCTVLPTCGSVVNAITILSDAGAAGSCPAAKTVTQLPEATSSRRARLCGGDGSSAACVARAGDQACPDAYPVKTVLFAGADDTRSCSACACAPPADIACGLAFGINCGSKPSPITSACVTKGPIDRDIAVRPVAVDGGCSVAAAGEARPAGAFAARDPVTVCCAR